MSQEVSLAHILCTIIRFMITAAQIWLLRDQHRAWNFTKASNVLDNGFAHHL
jgi:hypothetical protein